MFLFGNEMILFRNHSFLFGNYMFLFGHNMFLFGNYVFSLTNDLFPFAILYVLAREYFGRDLFLYEIDLFLFGNDMFLFGNDMLLFFFAKLDVAGRRCYVSIRLLKRRLARRVMAVYTF